MLEFIDCASAVRGRYQLQVLHCQRQAERMARASKARTARRDACRGTYSGPIADLVVGYAAIATIAGVSTATIRLRLREGNVSVFSVYSGKHCPPRIAVLRDDLPKLGRRARRTSREALQ